MFNKRNDALIEELKIQREEALNRFNDITLTKNEELAEFFFSKFQEGEDVPFALLENIPVGETIMLPVVWGGAIVTTKMEESIEDVIMYDTAWTEGSTLTWHFHSDCTEDIVVQSGRIKVYVQGSVHILRVGQKISVGAGIGHQITALKDTNLNIKFTRIKESDC